MTALLTPAQTAGPYLAIGLPWLDGPFVAPEGTPGAITITGAIRDGAGEPVHDAKAPVPLERRGQSQGPLKG